MREHPANPLSTEENAASAFHNLLQSSIGLSLSGVCRIFDPSLSQVQEFVASGLSLPAGLLDSPPKRQAEFLAGRWCAREALAQAGLPRLAPGRSTDRAPVWPKGTVGAITHCGTLAAAVAASTAWHVSVGLDIEAIQSDDKASPLMPQVMSKAEADMLCSIGIKIGLAFSLVFSAKETLFKTLYPLVQKPFYFANAQCVAMCLSTGQWSIKLGVTLSASHTIGNVYHGHLHIREGHVLTLMTLPNQHGCSTDCSSRS